MRSGRNPSLILAVALLSLLLAFQALPAFSAGSKSVPTAAPASSGDSSTVRFAPQDIILGQLEGTGIVQSQRPRSVPLADGVQFAATYYTSNDLQDAYNVSSFLSQGYGGKGETIAIIDAYGDPTINQDLATFDKDFGLPAINLTIIPVGSYDPANGITTGWDGETALDVEAAHAMAPYAHINLLVAANASNALLEAVKMAVDLHLGDVVSMSWGAPENSYGESGFSVAGFLNYAYLDYYFQKGAAEGITFTAATGDYGAFGGTTTVTANFPATSPFVTAVGGTTLYLASTSGYITALNTSASYQGETAWSVSPQYVGSQGVSSGGGYSDFFAQPYYQRAAINSSVRSVPDVSADANPYTGFLVVLEGGLYDIGGTSLATPLWAGMTADMDQYIGRSLGPLNPYLYSIYSNMSEYRADFHQVTLGYNGLYQAGPGYNLVTGLGSPNLPNLAASIKDQTQGLRIVVSTSPGSSNSAPTQYTYGENFTISASAMIPQGLMVSSGTFDANIESPQGTVATIPLYFDGDSWVGTYTVSPSDPPGSWTVEVFGSSGGFTGYGIADISIGDSLGIVEPVPYPYATTTLAGHNFTILAIADFPNGTALTNASLTAYLTYGGRHITSVKLFPQGRGFYANEAIIGAGDPQGSYKLVINGTGVGSVYSYLYVGEEVTGVLLGPLDTAIPSVSPGQQVVLLARTLTSNGNGEFTSNVTAKIYSLSGNLVASVNLQPAPNTVQYGVFDFFGYNQANFTIPASLTPGFYQLQFISSYQANMSSVVQQGNYTTGFYVSGPQLTYTLSAPATVYEGQNVEILAKITNSTGDPIDSGVFFGTLVPSGYTFEAYLTDADGYTGVPMQYSPSLGEWVGIIQIPSVLTSFNAFVGNTLSLPSGPWTAYIAGESGNATNVTPTSSYVDVLPYTYYTNDTLSPSNINGAPLVVVNGTAYLLSDIGAARLVISGLNITISDSSIGNLTIVNSNVRLVATDVVSVSATGSKLALADGTQVENLSLKSTSLASSGSYYGQTSSSGYAIDYLVYAVAVIAVLGLIIAILAYSRKRPQVPPPQAPPQV